MASPPDPARAAERVEELLADLQAADPRARDAAEELVRVLLDLYGAALARVLDLARDEAGTVGRLAGDPLLSALLVLHDLHPEPAEARIERALARIRPHLGSHAGGVELLGMDGDGVIHLRLEGSCHGCPSSAATVKGAVEAAVMEAAPEAVAVEVEGLVQSGSTGFVPLESVGMRCPAPLSAEGAR